MWAALIGSQAAALQNSVQRIIEIGLQWQRSASHISPKRSIFRATKGVWVAVTPLFETDRSKKKKERKKEDKLFQINFSMQLKVRHRLSEWSQSLELPANNAGWVLSSSLVLIKQDVPAASVTGLPLSNRHNTLPSLEDVQSFTILKKFFFFTTTPADEILCSTLLRTGNSETGWRCTSTVFKFKGHIIMWGWPLKTGFQKKKKKLLTVKRPHFFLLLWLVALFREYALKNSALEISPLWCERLQLGVCAALRGRPALFVSCQTRRRFGNQHRLEQEAKAGDSSGRRQEAALWTSGEFCFLFDNMKCLNFRWPIKNNLLQFTIKTDEWIWGCVCSVSLLTHRPLPQSPQSTNNRPEWKH